MGLKAYTTLEVIREIAHQSPTSVTSMPDQ